MTVELTPSDLRQALLAAWDRWEESETSGRQDALVNKSWFDAFKIHWYGAIGEVAVAKALNVYAPLHCRQFGGMASDLTINGKQLEVRHRIKHEHDLIIRDRDSKDRLYVLSTGEPPSIEVHGYWDWSKSLLEVWRVDHGGYNKPAYFVPKSALIEMEVLSAVV